MTELQYKFTYDTLFKLLFVKHPELLKRLISAILGISTDSITEFEITNPEIPPEAIGEKFCKLDINMNVDTQRINLEVQVEDESDFRERTMYYWARLYSSALKAGEQYSSLPRVIIISIVDFLMFDSTDYCSDFMVIETKRHELLSDRMKMLFLEVRKLPKEIDPSDELELLLSLFRVKTEEELMQLEDLEVPVVNEAIHAYREVVVSPQFRELERLRTDAKSREASALADAEQRGESRERAKWEEVVADKDAAIADKDAALADKDAAIADKDAAIADKDAEIEKLRAQLDNQRE